MLPEPRRSRTGGFAASTLLIWILVLLGGYTAVKFIPILSTRKNIERVVRNTLEDVSHETRSDVIRAKIVNRARASTIPLSKEQIQIQRERFPGERVIHVAVDHPISYSFLGGERTLESDIEVTEVYEVNEANEARKARLRRKQREELQRKVELREERREVIQEAMGRCEEKWGEGNCTYTESGHPFAEDFELVETWE